MENITWPGLRNVNIFLLIITTVGALKLFTQVDILTKGGPNGATTTIIHYLFKQGYATQKVGYASTAEPIIEETLARTPAAIAEVQAELPQDFSPRVLDAILGGLEQAARTLGGMPP